MVRTFIHWLLLRNENDTAQQVQGAFNDLRGAYKQGADAKNLEYAKRIVAGEDPTVVMQGLRQGGAMWTAVMQQVEQLKKGSGGGMPPALQPQQASPPQPQPFSVSGLESKLGIRTGTLSVEKSKDGQYVFVRNRLNGKSVSAQPNPQAIEQAAKKLFGLI